MTIFLEWAIIVAFLLMVVAGGVWAWRNRAVAISDDLRRAGEESRVDPTSRAESIVNRGIR